MIVPANYLIALDSFLERILNGRTNNFLIHRPDYNSGPSDEKDLIA